MEMIDELSDEEKELPLFVGVKEPGSTADDAFAVRLFRIDSPPGVLLSSIDVPEGSTVQLHGRDMRWAERRFQQEFAGCAQPHSGAGAFVYGCVAADHITVDVLASALGPAVEFSGGFCQGEFVRLGDSASSTSLTSSSTTVGLLMPQQPSRSDPNGSRFPA